MSQVAKSESKPSEVLSIAGNFNSDQDKKTTVESLMINLSSCSKSNSTELSLVNTFQRALASSDFNGSTFFVQGGSQQVSRLQGETNKNENASFTSKDKKVTKTRKPRRVKKWKKPKDKPKRPLSAYNLFFHAEREHMVNSVDQATRFGGFGGMAKSIAARWNTLSNSERHPYEEEARGEKKKYFAALEVWKAKKAQEAAVVTAREVSNNDALSTKIAPSLKGTIPKDISANQDMNLSDNVTNDNRSGSFLPFVTSLLEDSLKQLDELPSDDNGNLSAMMPSALHTDPILDELASSIAMDDLELEGFIW